MSKQFGLSPLLFERVVIKPDAAKTKSASGLIIPNASKDTVNTGIIIALGHLVIKSEVPIKVGDHVLYHKLSGTPLSFDGEDYTLMMVSDIIAPIINH